MRALERHDPRTIGRYRVLARISAGGLAIVYFGRSSTGRAVALKAVHAEFAADPAYRDRFRREVAAARAVGGRYSPGIVDADPDAAVPWLAMEFLPSVTLRDAAPLPSPAVWTVAAGLVEALASVHRAGVAHLDLKPANVLLTATVRGWPTSASPPRCATGRPTSAACPSARRATWHPSRRPAAG